MTEYWTTVKTLTHEDQKLEFQVLMADMRGPMCDSLAPEMCRVPERNRIVFTNRGDKIPSVTLSVPTNLGNYYYKILKENTTDSWEYIMDECCLDVYAYYDDFGSYSDFYKELNNVRPHYTDRQWDEVVRRARKIRVGA